MAERRGQTITERLDIRLEVLSTMGKMELVTEIFDTLSALELREMRDLAEQKRKGRESEAKDLLLKELQVRAESMGMPLDSLFPQRRRARKDTGRPLPVKYRSPDGDTWAGRGIAPQWLTKLEAAGHNREEYVTRLNQFSPATTQRLERFAQLATSAFSAALALAQLLPHPIGRTHSMNPLHRLLVCAVVTAITVLGAAQGRADDGYVVTNLTSDLDVAPNLDPVLQNAWGVAFTPGASPFWIADNATGCATLYDGQGAIASTLQVKLPLPGGSVPATACQHVDPNNPPDPTPAAPTGLVWNPTSTFLVPGTTMPATFIFDTEDGTISAWSGGLTPADQAVLAVDNSPGAVYKGLVFGTNVHGVFLFATNFRAGTIDVFAPNGSAGFRPATPNEIDGGFTDPNLPAGFAPFGIQNINGDLFVTYAKQNEEKHDDVAGPGNGFVDVFNTDGHLLRRFANQGPLNSPWGVARASFAFGRFSGDILIGNFGDGHINAFESDGNFLGTLQDLKGEPVVIDGLWTLTLGGGRNSSSDTLYFTAGPNRETDGLFGTITPASQK